MRPLWLTFCFVLQIFHTNYHVFLNLCLGLHQVFAMPFSISFCFIRLKFELIYLFVFLSFSCSFPLHLACTSPSCAVRRPSSSRRGRSARCLITLRSERSVEQPQKTPPAAPPLGKTVTTREKPPPRAGHEATTARREHGHCSEGGTEGRPPLLATRPSLHSVCSPN